MIKSKLNRKLYILITIIIMMMFSACSSKNKEEIFESVSQLDGHNIGCMSGSIFDALISEKFPNSDIVYFGSRSELLLGLETGKIDGFISDEPVAMMMISQNKGVTYLDETVGEVEYGICFSNENKDKLIQFNQYLAKISTNGHLKELQDKWINVDGASQKKEELTLSGENGTLRCVTTPDAAPFSFLSDNIFQGFEVELLNEFCNEYGYNLEINTVNFDALLTSVATNKYDVAFNGIYITPERAKSVNFANSTLNGRDVVMIRNGETVEKKGFIESIRDSFYHNFIEEDRYKLLISGAITTLLISVFSIIFGSLYGLLIHSLSNGYKSFRKVADFVQGLLAKLPAVVILMLLFYVVFNKSSISGLIVSVIGFSFMFGNTFYGLLKSGVASVDTGQREAALALGYDTGKAFFRIILPQALKTVLDTYLKEVANLIKNTSIVGYVSVNDVTRSSDIIRGRTYDALFPLIVVAIIYYLLCTLLVELVKKPLTSFLNKKVNYDD